MHQPPSPSTPTARPLFDEADIGSGEKTAAQQETEELIRQIPLLPPSAPSAPAAPADVVHLPRARAPRRRTP